MEENTELNLGKITAKFAIKFILWAILVFVIGAIILFVAFGSKISNTDENNIEEMMSAINGFIWGLSILDLVVAFIATKLSVGGIAKKQKITEENRPLIFKRMSIVLVVITVIIFAIHFAIVGMVKSSMLDAIDNEYDSISQLIKDAEEELEEENYVLFDKDEIEEAISGLKGMNTAGNIYVVFGLAYAAMIPVANMTLKKKSENN